MARVRRASVIISLALLLSAATADAQGKYLLWSYITLRDSEYWQANLAFESKTKPVQPQLPGMPPPLPPGTRRIFPMQLQIGDRMTDEAGEWEVVGRLYTTAGGKNGHVRVQRVEQPGVTEVKLWGAYEKISVQRAEGKR